MSISNHVAQFVGAVSIHFPSSTRGEDAEMWLASMDRVLRNIDADVLAVAAEIIIETRDPVANKGANRWFPAPRECLVACDKARERIRLQSAPPMLSHGQSDGSKFAAWRMDLANDLIRGSLGQQAAREGWALALRDWCRDNGRLPDEREARACRATALGFDEALAMCRAGDGGLLTVPLTRLGESMLEERRTVTEQITKGE